MLKIVGTESCEASMGIDSLLVTVEGDNIDEVLSSGAKQVAYDERKNHGLHGAGISAAGGPFPIDVKTGNAVASSEMAEISKRLSDIKYRITFKLTQGMD
jgi:hypothetical protein